MRCWSSTIESSHWELEDHQRQNLIIMMPALLILLGSAVILQADLLPDKTFALLPPVNFTIKVAGLAQVLLRWEPNPDQEQTNVMLGYHVKINGPQEDAFETKNTESKHVSVLHHGFSASVQTIPWTDHTLLASSWVSAELKAPPGSPGTSIVNLTCTTNTVASDWTRLRPYQVSLHCTWCAGKDAPEDTQYFLYYRYGSQTEECQEYTQDTLKRNHACWFPRAIIDSKGRDWLAVHVNGSSKHAAIKPFDQLFALQAIDQVNSPVNVTAKIEGTRLSIQWEKPVSAFQAHCFDYEVKIYNTRKGYFQTENMTTSEFNSTIRDISKYSIQVRAAVKSACRDGGLWSKWSQPIYVEEPLASHVRAATCSPSSLASSPPRPLITMTCVICLVPVFPDGRTLDCAEEGPTCAGPGNDEPRPWTEWFLVVLMATICILFILSLTCRRCHVWTKLFPPVPAPKSNIKDFIVTSNYEKTGSGETEIEVLSFVEEPGLEVLEDFVF